MRDFLVQLKEFAGSDELFEADREAALNEAKEKEEARRRMVPGIAPQWDSTDIREEEESL
eukprot:CAMPEP_0113850078 /NCGR_PEP_ID=MMETSP0372-20130328/3600_1 /TAXON_ID=340204 /ORGANISM="Lankesteria abbotti" /LENGTH=59 /DNA_ID=CAMNT_0000820167 /DNA_START=310 /DNA_END=489 /DNA_ORIENTATION=+ /assembly_acc=CAM_ASM_000359